MARRHIGRGADPGQRRPLERFQRCAVRICRSCRVDFPSNFVLSEITVDNYANQNYIPPSPRLQKGTLRGRHGTLARVAMDACCAGACTGRNAAAYGEVVWSWRRDPGVKLLVSPTQRRWQKRPLTGESTKEAVKPLRGESRDVSAVPVKPVCVLSTIAHGGLRAQSAPGFPCALCSRREQRDDTTRAKTSRGNENICAQQTHCRPGQVSEASATRDP